MTTINRTAEQCRPLRDALGRYATGVAVITTSHRGRRAGLTVNSFTSVSLDPPLILWCLNRTSTTRAVFGPADHFAVHVLGADQHALAITFSRPGDRFAGLPIDRGPYDLPLLGGAIATLICRRERLVSAGDHVVSIGRVLEHRTAAGVPLLFVDGTFCTGSATQGVRRPADENQPAAWDQQSVFPLMAGKPG